MAQHVRSNKGVCRAFANNEVTHARNSKNTLWFKDLRTLYSYGLPIAWRTSRGKFIIRDSWNTITTQRHISQTNGSAPLDAISNFPVELMANAGVDVPDVLDYYRRWEEGWNAVVFEMENTVYTLISLKAEYWKDKAFHTRNLVPMYFCFEGSVSDYGLEFFESSLGESLLPNTRELTIASHSGHVAFTGEWFFVLQPDVDARTSEHQIKRFARVGDSEYHATEGLGDYVRGVIRGPDGKTFFSFNTDGLEGTENYWYLPVRPTVMPATELEFEFWKNAYTLEGWECQTRPEKSSNDNSTD